MTSLLVGRAGVQYLPRSRNNPQTPPKPPEPVWVPADPPSRPGTAKVCDGCPFAGYAILDPSACSDCTELRWIDLPRG